MKKKRLKKIEVRVTEEELKLFKLRTAESRVETISSYVRLMCIDSVE